MRRAERESDERTDAGDGRPSTARASACIALLVVAIGCGTNRHELPPGTTEPEASAEEDKGWTKEQKFLAVNGGMALVIAAYGFQFWDYGGAHFQTVDEGWFGQETSYGGADKLGHAYAAYLTTVGLATLYEGWGYERSKADLYGALSSMGAYTLIEVGDGFSKNGYSWEDIAVDAAGVAFGYWRRRAPAVGRLVDFRVEYIPSETFINGDHSDIVTDYSGFKYLLAFKLDGIEKLSKTPLGWLELQAGYYTRGFATGDDQYFDEKERKYYFAIGLNVSRLFKKLGLRGLGTVFEYYQMPYTYVPFDWTIPP